MREVRMCAHKWMVQTQKRACHDLLLVSHATNWLHLDGLVKLIVKTRIDRVWGIVTSRAVHMT